MMNQQFPYQIYNPTYLNPNFAQQLELQRQQRTAEQKHWEQVKKIHDMVNAISDYCEAAREIEPEYEQAAIMACAAEIARQMEITNQKNGGIR